MSCDAGYYYVYMLTNASRVVLYIGVTSDLEGRLYEHRISPETTFCGRYKVHHLVYYEDYPDPTTTIAREKQLKGWTRAKKNALVTGFNRRWRDLGEDILQR